MKNLFQNWRARAVVVLTILLLTAFIFGRFFLTHPAYWRQLGHIAPSAVAAIVLLNALGLVVLVGINHCLVRLCGARLGWLEQFQLTSYSAVANFFGPLQSGPGVRAVYLKTQHGVRLRDYTLATLIYYGLFALISAVFLFGFSRPWWQAAVIGLVVVAVSYFVIRRLYRRAANDAASFRWEPAVLVSLVLLTLVQVAVIALWYFVELRAVAPGTSLHQALVYTGAANFALFVSLTPDAIGFREAFLLFAQKLHGISTATIISANLLDRAVYAAFLAGLFVLTLATHGWAKFRAVRQAAER